MSATFVETSRLGNIIQMIGLAQQSGILRVVRMQGGAREIGQIRFVRGEPTAALLGPLVGPGALNVLTNWGECAYAFDESSSDDSLADLAALSGEGRSGVTSGSWPSYHYPPTPTPHSAPSAPSPASYSLPSGESPAISYPTPGAFPAVASDYLPPSAGLSSPSGSWSTSLPTYAPPQVPGHAKGAAQPQPMMPSMGAVPTTLPSIVGGAIPGDVLTRTPVRTAISERLDQLPLDRHERMVLLLIDGKRPVAELMRLTRRSEWEVYNVLRHLEGLGLIQVGR